MLFGKTTEMMKHFIGMELDDIRCGVDATMGNGNDTLFLSRFAGDEGRVFAFDIQERALKATKATLDAAGVSNVQLILDSHANMKAYVKEAELIMFNLGYLPKGDHNVITTGDTTCVAIAAGLDILKTGGLLTIISYYGHDGGLEEKNAVQRLLKDLDQSKFDVLEISSYNKSNDPPVIYIVRKKNNV